MIGLVYKMGIFSTESERRKKEKKNSSLYNTCMTMALHIPVEDVLPILCAPSFG